MRIDLFDYELPEELIAARPTAARDGARMLVVPSGEAPFRDAAVRDLARVVPEGALLVVNDTKVLPARLFGRKASGGAVELLLVERVGLGSPSGTQLWRALARSSKPLRFQSTLALDGAPDFVAKIVSARNEEGLLDVELSAGGASVDDAIAAAGHMPLPPYIKREDEADDRLRYQTLFARVPGAVAAPTAGLHLSEAVLAELAARGVQIARVTLHVSLGTFQPVKVDDLDQHPMHAESFEVGADTVAAIASARARGAAVVAVGTTSVRALESAADPDQTGLVRASSGRTRILIQPGYTFRVVDALLTNFHLPRSTLLALVSAFAGRERILSAYAHAVRERYRFFSYGDAMYLERPR